jgi:hypothetical protein
MECKANCARTRVCADKAAGITRVDVRVSIAALRNSRGSRGASREVKAAAYATHMSVDEAKYSYGAKI